MADPKVLIVDDSKTIRTQLTMILKKNRISSVEAESGEACLNLLREQDDIALIFLDVNMPGMTGIDVLRYFKSETFRSHPRIVMLTTESDEGLIEEARKLGAKGWLIKPFSAEKVLMITTKFLEEKAS